MKESTAWRRIAEEVDLADPYWVGICHYLWSNCMPLDGTTDEERFAMKRQLSRLFNPRHGVWYWDSDKEGRNCRVLACLFLAAMTEKL